MRIVCPNCASQYEVAPDAIPEAGRDVQCAKCAEIWFQNPPMQLTLEEPTASPEAEAEAVIETQTTAPAPEPMAEPQPETVSEPQAPQAEETPQPSAVFRSLRTNRDVATPAPTPVDEPKQKQRQSITPEIKSILQQEAEYSARQQTQEPAPEPEPITTEEQPTPQPEQVAPQPDIEELSRQMRALEKERDQLVRKQAEADPSESVTLASAKSLRDILESEVIDPVDITDAVPEPATPEPSLEKLGLKRPTPIIQAEEPAPTIVAETAPITPEIAPAPLAPEADIASKSGKAVFADIDELNPNNADDETDILEEDLIDFQDDELKEKASKFSIGFLAACALVMVATTLYFFAPKIAGSVPALSGPMTSYHEGIDHRRMVLQDMYYQGGEPGFATLLNNAKSKLME